MPQVTTTFLHPCCKDSGHENPPAQTKQPIAKFGQQDGKALNQGQGGAPKLKDGKTLNQGQGQKVLDGFSDGSDGSGLVQVSSPRPGTALTQEEKRQLRLAGAENFSPKTMADAFRLLEACDDSFFKKDGLLTPEEAKKSLSRIDKYLQNRDTLNLMAADNNSWHKVLPANPTEEQVLGHYRNLRNAAAIVAECGELIAKVDRDGMISGSDIIGLIAEGVLGPNQRIQGAEGVTQNTLIRQGWPSVSLGVLRNAMKVAERFADSGAWMNDGKMDRREVMRAHESIRDLLARKDVKTLMSKDDSWRDLGSKPPPDKVIKHYERIADVIGRALQNFDYMAGLGEHSEWLDSTDFDKMGELGVMAPNPRAIAL